MIIFSDALKAAFDFILPQSCILCEKEIEQGMICNNCLEYLPLVNPPLCTACGRPTKDRLRCAFCSSEKPLDRGRAWMLFIPPADKVVHHFKYRLKTRLADLLGRAMAGIIKADHILSQADVLTPVPLFWWKTLRRTYNQSDILAGIISSETGIAQKDLLKRTRNTRTQTRLSEEARRQNVRGAFEVRGDVYDKNVLLVDDVLTTGATMSECARVFKEHGAAAVYSCVAAITPDRPHGTRSNRPV
ncbi:MAG: ComF family protein [candidate division WOR-3 bacterium]|nr:MAG: ComF family protein [candidate division WOR-3 bacterium]